MAVLGRGKVDFERGGMGAAEGVGYGSGLGYMGYISCMVARFHGYIVTRGWPGGGVGMGGQMRAKPRAASQVFIWSAA